MTMRRPYRKRQTPFSKETPELIWLRHPRSIVVKHRTWVSRKPHQHISAKLAPVVLNVLHHLAGLCLELSAGLPENGQGLCQLLGGNRLHMLDRLPAENRAQS